MLVPFSKWFLCFQPVLIKKKANKQTNHFTYASRLKGFINCYFFKELNLNEVSVHFIEFVSGILFLNKLMLDNVVTSMFDEIPMEELERKLSQVISVLDVCFVGWRLGVENYAGHEICYWKC